MAIDKKTFLKSVTIIYDTREQKNKHILDKLTEMGVMTEQRKLDYGDYSFAAEGRDYSMSCVIERKADIDELYGNIMSDRERLEKEFHAAYCLAKELTLLIENVGSWDELKQYQLPKHEMDKSPMRKVKEIGAYVYPPLRAWQKNNRYGFKVEFVKDNKNTAAAMLNIFYYYWRDYKELTAERK